MIDVGETPYRRTELHELASLAVERVCKESGFHWTYNQFKRILILCGAGGVYVSAPYRPESIDLGRVNGEVRDLQQRSDRHGVEFSRTFIVDTQRQKLLAAQTFKGDPTSGVYRWKKQRGRELVQKASLAIHVHPRVYLDEKGINPFSDADVNGFVMNPEQVFDILSMGDYVVVAMKTSVTPNAPSRKVIKELTSGIAQHHKVPVVNMWNGMREAIRANKEMCIALGLMYYLGRTGEPVKRVPLVER